MKVTTLGIDLANIFHVHGVDKRGCFVLSEALRRKRFKESFLKKSHFLKRISLFFKPGHPWPATPCLPRRGAFKNREILLRKWEYVQGFKPFLILSLQVCARF